jgi:hypothetical protein
MQQKAWTGELVVAADMHPQIDALPPGARSRTLQVPSQKWKPASWSLGLALGRRAGDACEDV